MAVLRICIYLFVVFFCTFAATLIVLFSLNVNVFANLTDKIPTPGQRWRSLYRPIFRGGLSLTSR